MTEPSARPAPDAAAAPLAVLPPTRWQAARTRTTVAAVLLVVFVVMLVLVAGFREPPRIDTGVRQWFVEHRSTALTAFFRVVTTVGSPVGVAVSTAAVVAVLCARRRSTWPLLLGAVSLVGAQVIGTVLKVVVARPRPPLLDRVPGVSANGLDFPSGHSTQSAAAYLVLAVLLAERVAARGRRAVIYLVAGIAIALVGTSRLYLGVHWFTDVTASWCLGLGWTCAVLAGATWWGSPAPASRRTRTAVAADAQGDR